MFEVQSDKIMRDYLEKIGFSPIILEGIGTISVYAATIEFWIERVIWKFEETSVVGIRPRTDCKQISQLIKDLNEIQKTLHSVEVKEFIKKWCDIAKIAYEIRNAMIHGFPAGIGKNVAFYNHLRWEGELRKKEFSEFYADETNLSLLKQAFSILARSIIFLEKSSRENLAIGPKAIFIREFQTALSIVRELRYQAEAVNSEKY